MTPPNPLRRALRRHRWSVSFLALFAATVDAPRPAGAAWPPAPNATVSDVADPTNWPNDPSYGYRTATRPGDRESGQWEFYGFLPERSPGVPPIRAGETAAGMSVDLAFRHTIGDDRVLIAVIDSGIKWDDDDLLDKAFINKGELAGASQLPVRSDGGPCAPLDAAQPTVDLLDCNGDGVFSVSDYEFHPVFTATNAGDLNRNGRRDAGDLILAFSDGVDDDGNGYVDDISGWDFFINDNDPYDDTRYGHGTSEAKDSSAATNNGIGMAGMCPRCRFVPLRVGDSFIADVQDYAKSVVYGVDMGATVIQEALGTLNMSSFAQAAHDYAWSKGTIVIASMADENSRHHNMPAASNHTLPVHAIHTQDAKDSTSTTSFFAFNNCSNYGGQNFLSASGSPCSSEAVGNLSGLAGLVYSMALQSGYGVPGGQGALTAAEVLQLFTTTTDDIDIAESRQPDSQYEWSQPGFDQRFGYGRVNANSAVEAVKAGRIPPEVDLTRPYWFEVLHPNRVAAPVPIHGTIGARRAQSYDYVVEWAPGVQPLDGDFTTLREDTNVPASTVLGADGTPLADLDVRSLDPTHEWDSDSPMGENQYTITVRVRVTAHYGGAVGDVPGEIRRTLYVHDDPDLVPGFPVYLGGSGESSPKLADIDGDGVRDIIMVNADGKVAVLTLASGEPRPVAGFPYSLRALDGFTDPPLAGQPDYRGAPAYNAVNGIPRDTVRESGGPAPAIADLTGDGKLDIVITSLAGTIYLIRNDGTDAPGWPVRLPDVPSCPLADVPNPPVPCMDEVSRIERGAYGSPVLIDMDKDGALDIVQGAFDGKVHVFSADGQPVPGWPVTVRYDGRLVDSKEFSRVFTTPAVADFNGDGFPEVLVGSNERIGAGNTAGAVYLLDGRGTNAPSTVMPNWPITMTSFNIFPVVAEGIGNSGIVADTNGDGEPEAIAHGNASSPLILPADPGEQRLISGTPPNALPERIDPVTGDPKRGLRESNVFGAASLAQLPDTMLPLFAQPAAGDLDLDGRPDVIAQGGSLSMASALLAKGPNAGSAQHMLGFWKGTTGEMFPGSPVLLEDFSFFNSQAVADVSGDGYPEILTGSAGYYLHAVDACGRIAPGFPHFTGQWIIATPAVGDIDGDEGLEVVVSTRSGWLYAWDTAGRRDGVIQWESFHHDNRNTGNYAEPLEQGTLRGDTPELEIGSDGLCVVPEVDAGVDAGPPPTGNPVSEDEGGCGCRTPAGTSSRGASALLLGLLGVGAARRRRSRGDRR